MDHVIPVSFRPVLEALWQEIVWFFKAYYKFSGTQVAQDLADQIELLEAKSDEELAALGIFRDEIPHYVVREFMHI